MRTSRGIGAIVIAAATAATMGAGRPNVGVKVVGGTPEQRAMASWAVLRFGTVGLRLPLLEIRFHAEREACHGHLGRYRGGVVDACWRTTGLVGSRALLHEMAHGWIDANLTDDVRDRFLELRGLATWNDSRIWDERGYEHAAEIIAWAIGDQADGDYLPSIPDNDPDRLAEAYRLLTGDLLPELPSWRWRQPE